MANVKSVLLYLLKLAEQILVLTVSFLIALIIAFHLIPLANTTKPTGPYQCNAVEKRAHLPQCETGKP